MSLRCRSSYRKTLCSIHISMFIWYTVDIITQVWTITVTVITTTTIIITTKTTTTTTKHYYSNSDLNTNIYAEKLWRPLTNCRWRLKFGVWGIILRIRGFDSSILALSFLSRDRQLYHISFTVFSLILHHKTINRSQDRSAKISSLAIGRLHHWTSSFKLILYTAMYSTGCNTWLSRTLNLTEPNFYKWCFSRNHIGMYKFHFAPGFYGIRVWRFSFRAFLSWGTNQKRGETQKWGRNQLNGIQ